MKLVDYSSDSEQEEEQEEKQKQVKSTLPAKSLQGKILNNDNINDDSCLIPAATNNSSLIPNNKPISSIIDDDTKYSNPSSDDDARTMIRQLTKPNSSYTCNNNQTSKSSRIYQLAQLKSPKYRSNKPLVHIHTRMAATQLDMLRPGWADEQLAQSYGLDFYTNATTFSKVLPQASQLPTLQQLQVQSRQKPRTRIEFLAKKN
ncbi:uncharacterized protein SAPINGB_P005788 [Magnusiomyces paraingens]|uniref:Uncharacterized protein n=1 Tax=Magnusiomyces paraingens TaxID=2606893 RepID=A0A5E8C1L5_9ASCO|nr:uncharacterized protein SAPINGB_P005788 [Saprochaete ingens]VVT57624.1 unnamed protein product [Saprochaete ingens]